MEHREKYKIKRGKGVCFEYIIAAIYEGKLLGIIGHNNKQISKSEGLYSRV